MYQSARQPTDAFNRDVRGYKLPCQALPPITATLDLASLVAACAGGQQLYEFYLTHQVAPVEGAVGVGTMTAILFVLLARSQGLYRLEVILAPLHNLKRIGLMLAFSLLVLTCVLFLLKSGAAFSRGSMIAFGALAFFLVPACRLVSAAAANYGIHRGSVGGRRSILIGDTDELTRLRAYDLLQFGIDEIARFALVADDRAGRGLTERGRIQVARAIELARVMRVSEYALIIPWNNDRELAELNDLLRVSALPVRLFPDQKIREIVREDKDIGFNQYFSVEIQRGPLSGWERGVKRGLDLAVASLAIIILSPLLLLAALAIKLDSSGPVIFRQRRCGFDNREFVILKFRTMAVQQDGEHIVQATQDDRRVTRIGRTLRRRSIDELPQLLNVVRGEMSLVGPRPHALAHDEEYKGRIASYAFRHHVKPGLTGAAQIMGLRGETPRVEHMEQRVKQDLWYINNWSLTLDLTIIMKTCFALLRNNAY